jgi:hypothetical protein
MPAVGEHRLRIVAPDVLELTLITTKKDDSSKPSAWNFIGENFTPRLPEPGQFRVRADGQNIVVRKVGFKRRPLYAPLKKRDLRILNQIYLMTVEPIPDGRQVRVTSQLWEAPIKFEAAVDPSRFSPAIHINQVGYQTKFPKKAMVGHYLGTLGEMPIPAERRFRIIDANSGKEAFSGKLAARRDRGFTDSPRPYQHVYEADFSAFDTAGTYRLAVEGLGASLPFQIHDGTLATFARTYALGLYHQRCGTNNVLPFTRHTHDACHTAPADIPDKSFKHAQEIIGQVTSEARKDRRMTAPVIKNSDASLYPFAREGRIDVSGGHHDAGDYSKYTLNSAHLIHALVFAADYFPGAGNLDNLGIPESGDGKSDLLQEAKWEADFLAKMQDSDGGFFFLVYPKERRYEDNVLPDQGDSQVVWPKNTSATAAATAALAEIGSSPLFKKQFPEAADLYLRRALRGWAFLERAIKAHGKEASYQMLTHYGHEFLHDDELGWAAAALYAAIGEKPFQTRFIESFNPKDPKTRRWSWWPMFEGWGNAVRTYAFSARPGRDRQPRDDFRAACEDLIVETARNHVRFAADTAYGTSFPDPNKANRNAGWFFSSERAFDITVAYQLQPDDGMKEAVTGNLNYEAGCNPINISYITGLGWRRQREIVHQFAQNDHRVLPPAGIPIGNIQSGFAYLHHYKNELGELSFPPDGATSGAYPFYDRWGDSFNTTTEFVVVDQARGLASLAFWMAQTPVKSQSWRSAVAAITNVPAKLAVGDSATISLRVEGLDLRQARILWETRDAEPVFGPNLRLAPTHVGEQWIEAEALWPDGRRAFATASYEATASANTPPHALLSTNLHPMSGTAALFHFDGDLRDASGTSADLKLVGKAELDSSNLGWMRERKGAALRFHDLGDRVQGMIGPRAGAGANDRITLQAMIFLNAFKAYNRTNAKILSLAEGWNSSIELIENLYEGPMIKGGTEFSISKDPIIAAITPGTWHLLELTVSNDGYEARVDGKILSAIKKPELANWGRKPAVLEIGNFDGYIDEVLINWD